MPLSEVMSYTKLTFFCECGPRDPTNNLTTMVPKDQMSVLRETHSGRTSLQDMGKDVWDGEEQFSRRVTFNSILQCLASTCPYDTCMHDTRP